MPVRAVFFDVGETLVDEERYWREMADAAGIGPHVVWAALGKTIERGEEHWELWRHLGLERPAAWDGVVYSKDDLYPDALDCLERLRAAGLLVGLAGNQNEQLEHWARSAGLPVDIVTGSASLGVRKPDPAFFAGSWSSRALTPARLPTSATAPTTTRSPRSPRGSSPCTCGAGRGAACRRLHPGRSRSSRWPRCPRR